MNNGMNIAKGIGSGFVATIVLSAIMLMKQAMGVMRKRRGGGTLRSGVSM